MPHNDREVFAYFAGDPTVTREIALLAYASYAAAKHDWMELHEQRFGRAPTPDEADEWTASLPDSRLNEIRDTAVAFFADAATVYMQPQVEAAKGEAVEASVLAEVRRLNTDLAAKVERATSLRATWLPNLMIGIVASVMFTLFVMVGAAIYERDPSPFALFKPSPPPAAPQGPR